MTSCHTCLERPPTPLHSLPRRHSEFSAAGRLFFIRAGSIQARVGRERPISMQGGPGNRWVRGSPPLGLVRGGGRTAGPTGPWSAFCPISRGKAGPLSSSPHLPLSPPTFPLFPHFSLPLSLFLPLPDTPALCATSPGLSRPLSATRDRLSVQISGDMSPAPKHGARG